MEGCDEVVLAGAVAASAEAAVIFLVNSFSCSFGIWLHGFWNLREDVQHASKARDVPLLPFRPVARVVFVVLGVDDHDGGFLVGELCRSIQCLDV